MRPKTGRLVIASGASESNAVELVGETLVGLYMPAAWDAAELSFQASNDGSSFSAVYDFGAPHSVQAGAGQYIPIDYTKFVGAAYLKVKSQSGGSAVNQTAQRVITPVFRSFS